MQGGVVQFCLFQDATGESAKDEVKEKNGIQTTVGKGESTNENETSEKSKKDGESKNGKNAGEFIVDKNTQKILKSLSNGNGNKKPKK